MAYLIDTQIFIWALISPTKLSATARYALQNETIYVSTISLFEIAIKQKIGKLPDLPITTHALIEQLNRDGFGLLPLTPQHIACYNDVPLVADHRDPFDRLLLATALAERIPLISIDAHFSSYTSLVPIVW